MLMVLALPLALTVYFWHPEIPVQKLKESLGGDPSKYIQVNGQNIHYRDEGQGAVLLLLHGTGSNLHTWQGWTDTLQKRYRVIRPDLPAFGLSGPSPDRDYSMAAYSTFLDAFLDALGVDSCAVAGNSLGGAIAWHYALDRPDRVRRLVLIDASGFPLNGQPSLGFKMAKTPLVKQLMTRVTPKSLFRKSLLEVYAEPDLVTDSLVDLYFQSMLRQGNRQAFVDRVNTPSSKRIPELSQLAIPTLILWGGEDRWIPAKHGERFEQAIAGSELLVYPGVGHLPQEEIPWLSARSTEGYLCASGW